MAVGVPVFSHNKVGVYSLSLSIYEIWLAHRFLVWNSVSLLKAQLSLNAASTLMLEILASIHLIRLTVLFPADAVAGVMSRGGVATCVMNHLNLALLPGTLQSIQAIQEYPASLPLGQLARTMLGA